MVLVNSPSPTRLDARAVSYLPATNTFYHGALGDDFTIEGRHIQQYHPIAVVNHQAALKGDLDGVLEILDVESYRKWDRLRRGGDPTPGIVGNRQAALDATSLANITRVELSTAIINQMYKDVYLHHAGTFVPVPKLKYDYDIIEHMQTRGKKALVGKRQKAQNEAPRFSQTSFDLANYGRLQRTIDIPDEDEYTALLSPTSHMISDITQVVSQDINGIILEDGIQKFEEVEYGPWNTLAASGNQSEHNPLEQIAEETKRIRRNHGRADHFVMNSVQYAAFVSNTYVRGYEQMLTQREPGIFTFSKIPGLTFLIDEDMPNGVAAIISKRALTIGDGPMVTEAFRDPQQGVSGHVMRKWIQPVVNETLRSAFGTYMTGLLPSGSE